MRGERGQSVRVVGGFAINIVVAVAIINIVVAVAIYDAAAGHADFSTVPRDHRMRNPENGIPARLKSVIIVVGMTLRTMTVIAAGPKPAKTPLPLLKTSLSAMVTLSDAPVANDHPRFRCRNCLP
jgi:hypothetical protein